MQCRYPIQYQRNHLLPRRYYPRLLLLEEFQIILTRRDDVQDEITVKVELKPGQEVGQDELLAFCREHIARYKVPKRVVFGELPKTATGKVQKFILRQQVKSASAIE